MANALNIAIAGLGTVGCGMVRLIQQQQAVLQERAGKAIEIVAVSARDANKARDIALPAHTVWETDAVALAEHEDVDLVVELIGGHEGVAKELVEKALAAGKSVVTANKALIAHHGAELAALAEANRAGLRFEAAVAGGIPIIDAIQHGVAANHFSRITGILNGTGNFILTTMQQTGREFDDVLAEAQALGYAEADPSFDVDGIDTAHKLAILTSLAYGTRPQLEHMPIEGIRSITASDIAYAQELNYRIKLLGITEPLGQGICQRVHPCLVHRDLPMARVRGAFNAVQIDGSDVGRVLLEGQGAGAGPTASAVVSDILQLAHGTHLPPLSIAAEKLNPFVSAPMDALVGRYYIRLSVQDAPGVLASITKIFAAESISVQSLIQHEHRGDSPADVIMTTHETQEAAMQCALGQLKQLEAVMEPPQMIRIYS